MAGGAPFEQIIQHMLSSNNESRQAAEVAFEDAKQQPDGLVENLIRSLRSNQELEVRALCAVMLRRVSSLSIKASKGLSGAFRDRDD